ncbi:STM3941 family protein [Winogradskyella costae]|uniref:STM3941 family protein n=1 Tax=Winogradskyella costae TaxID=2697008 RepID=UPI0015C72C13|nr:STM3941 family protein [Winogradskyella costae]
MEDIIIRLSKTKLVVMLIFSLAFIVGGIYMIIDSNKSINNQHSGEFLTIIGVLSVLFFGLGSFFIAERLFTKKAGLKINDKGIFDYSNATSIGLIDWDDITGIETIQVKIPVYEYFFTVSSPKMLIINTSNPEKYIERSTNIISKEAMKTNNRMYGTPLTITSHTLKIKSSELETIISEKLKKRKNKNVVDNLTSNELID